MSQKPEMVLKAYLSRCPPAERSALERFLSPKEQKQLEQLPTFDAESEDKWDTGTRIHWSWFLQTLKTYPLRDQKLFLSALDPHAAQQLKASLNIKTPPEPLTEMGKTFLQEQLSISLTEEQILPAPFLPASPLNVLVSLGKKELIRLINLLSLYDLSAELRQIVETKILKKIYSFLSKEHQAFLKTISAQVSETHLFPRMGLDRNWDGTKESLEVLLHRRGLVRLGVALSGSHPDLIWTICHHLDIGRGGSLFKLCGKEPVPGISEIATQQVMECLHVLTKRIE
jgi:hypothetical protein